ncbi:uncharacterized protein J4E79_006332 [Alternaria viburni]|uniref:uncharacterized protein n=1 Tax=Alternaria viburni TaxID=566460 RepID=UPI0020C4BEA7|nr:uncharacterized protein J4E79_006332 [Alternaria viburni]KAI4659796.1 hypothetical protein J4E79_006332 [Alternaria viburni]
MSQPKITFYVDIVSPFAYIAFHVLKNSKAFKQVEVQYVPILLGGLMKVCGNTPPLNIKNKDKWINTERQRLSKQFNVPILQDAPPGFPVSTLPIQRALVSLSLSHPQKLERAIELCYENFWAHWNDPTKPENLQAILGTVLGSDEEAQKVIARTKTEEVKQALGGNTTKAFEDGAFGLPWFVGKRRIGALSDNQKVFVDHVRQLPTREERPRGTGASITWIQSTEEMDYYRQNELPETVKRYKTYTDQFQAWLLQTAFQRGVEIANVVADQAKKKKNKKGYRIPLQKQEQLVNAIAATSIPLADTSGIDDLGDAIRSRKEVTQYHKQNNTADLGHEYFNGSLEALMAVLKDLVPGINKARNGKTDTSTLVFIQFPAESNKSQDEQDDLLEKMRKRDQVDMDDGSQQQQPLTSKTKTKAPIPEENLLTAEEEQLRRDFLVLCFLYKFNRIRAVVYEVWVTYHEGHVNAMTAALVTDLAQDHLHQNVKALMEELDLLPGDLAILIRQLFDTIKAAPNTGVQNAATPLTEKALHHLFCLDDAAVLIKSYVTNKRPMKDSIGNDIQEHPLMIFLRFFDVIRKGNLKLPKWDHFTAEMLLHQSTSQDYLPFGLAIVLDIQEAVRDDCRRMLRDLTEHGLDIARCIRCHVDYEDRMWAKGTKPDYMCKEEIKFSTLLLKPLDRLLDWLQDVLNSREVPMAASVFITVHSTLAGLSMWHYNQIYHHTTITKIQWFINGLAHLYNAACQIGGLNIQWPDLDYLIKMHG